MSCLSLTTIEAINPSFNKLRPTWLSPNKSNNKHMHQNPTSTFTKNNFPTTKQTTVHKLPCRGGTPFSLLHEVNTEVQPKTESLSLYLVNTLGFSEQQSHVTATKLTHFLGHNKTVSGLNFTQNANSVVSFFKSIGLDETHIGKALIKDPRILLLNVDKTLKPKVSLLSQVGFSGSELVGFVSVNPSVLRYRLDLIVQALRGILGSDDNVIMFMKRLRSSSDYLKAIRKNLTQNVGLLEEMYGICGERIRKCIVQKPPVFLLSTESFRDVVGRVERKWGISKDCEMFLDAVCLEGSLNEKSIDRKCELFKGFGWTESDVLVIIRNNPKILTYSEARMKRMLAFYMNELGYQSAYLASCPFLFTCSLEKRVMPRHRVLLVLKEKGLLQEDYSLYQAVCCTESEFLEKLIQPYIDVIPGLHESYVNSIASSVKTPTVK